MSRKLLGAKSRYQLSWDLGGENWWIGMLLDSWGRETAKKLYKSVYRMEGGLWSAIEEICCLEGIWNSIIIVWWKEQFGMVLHKIHEIVFNIPS